LSFDPPARKRTNSFNEERMSMPSDSENPARTSTHFGYQRVGEEEKTRRVGDVFRSVAGRYDLMNDLMSGGMHRLWKRFAIERANLRPGERVLDVAGGSGDIASACARKVGERGEAWLTDINAAMLGVGRDQLIARGQVLPTAQCDAEKLPFPSDYFDCVTVAFGLRNMTHKERALAEMHRVLRAGGRLLVLEFSKVWAPLKPAYDAYSFNVLPVLGKFIAKDEAAYRYLAESIRMHPDQEQLKAMMQDVGFERVTYHNLSAGVVALHLGVKV
jgi:demethylmenaquinone methyltransferase / 2-methoxy-6-polyprenyl-1,4-benzoquinol methylase